MLLDETLDTYRVERKAFIKGLKHYYGIDFYKLDRKERGEWLKTYLQSKRAFFRDMSEIVEQRK
jgi:hypothetical protein